MIEGGINPFLMAVQGDTVLQNKLRDVTDAHLVVSIAKEAGYMISVEDLSTMIDGSEMSDEELENVAGGYFAVSNRCFQH